MSFSHHVFFCLNQRSNGEDCCDRHNAFALFDYAKNRVKELGLNGPGKIRVNKAGCLDRCADGPVMVIIQRAFGTPWLIRMMSKKLFSLI